MEPLTSRQISGTWATALLPINQDDSIDFGRLAQDLDYLLTTDVDGIYAHGTAGEFYALTEDEYDRINALLAEKCSVPACPFRLGRTTWSPTFTRAGSPRRAVEARGDPGDSAGLVSRVHGGGEGLSFPGGGSGGSDRPRSV